MSDLSSSPVPSGRQSPEQASARDVIGEVSTLQRFRKACPELVQAASAVVLKWSQDLYEREKFEPLTSEQSGVAAEIAAIMIVLPDSQVRTVMGEIAENKIFGREVVFDEMNNSIWGARKNLDRIFKDDPNSPTPRHLLMESARALVAVALMNLYLEQGSQQAAQVQAARTFPSFHDLVNPDSSPPDTEKSEPQRKGPILSAWKPIEALRAPLVEAMGGDPDSVPKVDQIEGLLD